MSLFQRLILRWPAIMAIGVSVFTLILLSSLYSSQSRLRAATDARLVADSQRRAAAISDFVTERRQAALEMAGGREIEAYLVNRALGMSPQYGLNANLDAIDQRFRQQIEKKTLRGQAVYTRIAFYGDDGAMLAESGKDEPGASIPTDPKRASRLLVDAKIGRIVVSAPVVYKGVFSGTVVTMTDLRLLSRLLIGSGATADVPGQYQEFLLTDQGTGILAPGQSTALTESLGRGFAALPENKIISAADIPGAEQFKDLLVLRTSIPGSALSMLTLTSQTDAYGQLASPAYVLFLSAFAAALLLAAVGFHRMRRRASQLQNDYAESDSHRAELAQRNLALSEEISRRQAVESALYKKTQELDKLNADLSASRERLDFALQGANDGLWDWNIQSGEVLYSNRWKEMLGFGESEIGNDLSEWSNRVHPEDLPRVMAAVKAHIHGKAPSATVECRILCKDGGWRWTLSRGMVVSRSSDGKALRLVGTNTDITDRKQAEAARAQLEVQLRESQKMEALGTLAGGVAHDFNNALAAILGNIELARQDVGPGHAALVSLDEIGKAGRRAKDMVQQILAFGRRQTLDRKPTSLSLVVVESARLIRATLPAGVSLNVECKTDTPAVLADTTQIKQILLNLSQNSLHAVQGQGRPGTIEIRLEACRPDAARGEPLPARCACLRVRDNGSGMDEATSSHIFEPFFTTKPKGAGTGLGLSVVHGIVQAHEARIEVDSAPGKGTEFRIYFPACEAQVPDAKASAPNASLTGGAGKHVLYVDDEEAIIFLMTRLLERQGYRVSGFTDPQEALAAARADPDQYDIAVTDYNMPGMSGLELATALRGLRADLPVVLASGYITEELRQMAPAAGVRELIYKPDTVDELCEAVARFANAQGDKSRPGLEPV